MQNKQQQQPPHPPHPQHQHPAPPPQAAARRVGTGAATKQENGNATEEGKQRKKARGTLFDVPWAVGNFFFFSFHYFVANKVFYTGFIYVTTTLQARGRDDEAAKGRPTTMQ